MHKWFMQALLVGHSESDLHSTRTHDVEGSPVYPGSHKQAKKII